MKTKVLTITVSFNSLQTGKYIQSTPDADAEEKEEKEEFQFPSNGKVYPKTSRLPPRRVKRWKAVSIPFKRESISKER